MDPLSRWLTIRACVRDLSQLRGEADAHPPRVTPPIYEEPTFGMRGPLIGVAIVAAVSVLALFLVARGAFG